MNRRIGLLLLVAMMGASACASGSTSSAVDNDSPATDASPAAQDPATDSPSDSGAPTTQSGGEATESTGASVADGGTPMAASSPIGQFFDGGFDDALVEYTVRVEESILVCMAAQGFDFAVSDDGRTNEIEERQNELTTREWTSEYGFGISTSFDSIASDQTSDRNTAIYLSMGEGERELWLQTLSGGGLEVVDGDFNNRPLEDQGCVGQALIETGGQEALEGLADFGGTYEEGQAALLDQREMIDAVDAWVRCMGTAGFPNFAALDDPEEAVGRQFDEVIAPLQAALLGLTDDEGQALISGESFDIANLPDLDVAALRELQAYEISVALADLDCYEAEVQAIYEPLRDDFELGLLDEYAAEFEALKNIGS